jgi:hypothetical protein
MIGDFIRRGQRGRAVSIQGLPSHRTPKNLCEPDALPTELYPRFGERRLARFINFSSSESGLAPCMRSSRAPPVSILIRQTTRKNDCRERFRV